MNEAEERGELERGLAALRRVGAEVTGYRAPSWDLSPRTVRLLGEYGLAYSSNFMDAITPYRHPGTTIAEVPVHWTLDDVPHFWFSSESWTRKIASAAEVATIWQEEAAGIARLGGVATFTFHPQIIGRPGRLDLLHATLRAAAEDPTVWVRTAGQVAATATETIPNAAPAAEQVC